MNYAEMSDFEINKAVATYLKSTGRIVKVIVPCTQASLDVEYQRKVQCLFADDGWGWFDPCNSWVDAGPIIQENRICIVADGEEPCSLGSHGGHQWWSTSSECRTFQCNYQSNPLRAAMIVLLMLKGDAQ